MESWDLSDGQHWEIGGFEGLPLSCATSLNGSVSLIEVAILGNTSTARRVTRDCNEHLLDSHNKRGCLFSANVWGNTPHRGVNIPIGRRISGSGG